MLCNLHMNKIRSKRRKRVRVKAQKSQKLYNKHAYMSMNFFSMASFRRIFI